MSVVHMCVHVHACVSVSVVCMCMWSVWKVYKAQSIYTVGVSPVEWYEKCV